ncbi:MAG: glycoside hydrolase family 43 protein [Phycisphaerales bacterium]|nr:glycoside hydrolase family 43 protein [Phycisphaerales bacterium]
MRTLILACAISLLTGCQPAPAVDSLPRCGNPIIKGWYADPEAHVFGGRVWVYPTLSAPYNEQTRFDAFSSPDLVTWTKHERVLTSESVPWAKRAMWAPSVVEHRGRYYFFFAANDIQLEGEWSQDRVQGGIGVAAANTPAGPFKDLLGRPLIGRVQNGAQPIDQQVWRDEDETWYMVYGGWGRCNICRLSDDFTRLVPFGDGETFKEITPEGYVEGPFMFRRNGKVYFMWSEGGWTGPDYSVAYAVADSPLGPFTRIGKVLQQDPSVARGAGHHSVLHLPGAGDDDGWYIVYHRRPLGETDGNHRVVCIDRMEFEPDGRIKPVRITVEGVPQRRVAAPAHP